MTIETTLPFFLKLINEIISDLIHSDVNLSFKGITISCERVVKQCLPACVWAVGYF